MSDNYDLLVVGGGVNGTAIARDAAGRGLKVLLAERDDLASGTSQASSKLIHGGLRYLEHLEFRLVKESLKERELLLKSAPHIIRPLDFVLPWIATRRSGFKVRMGLFLYDYLAGKSSLAKSHQINLRRTNWGRGLKHHYRLGFTYSDCWVDDARFVVSMAMDAAQHGATILTRTEIGSMHPDGKGWNVELRSGGSSRTVSAGLVINVTGVRADQFAREVAGIEKTPDMRLVKGSHIVVPRLHAGDHALILQNHDDRVVFILPFERHFSLIGTTDTPIDDPDREHVVDEDEIDYLLSAVAPYVKQVPGPDDVVWSFAGTRPLKKGSNGAASTASRDYSLDLSKRGDASMLTVIGGKVTAARKLAETVLDRVSGLLLAMQPAWTANATLPGGDIEDIEGFHAALQKDYPDMQAAFLQGMADRHGSHCRDILGNSSTEVELGRSFGGGLCEREIDWLREHEWAVTAQDILWRRTKCGLHMSAEQRDEVVAFLGS
ncbi:MAG: glycerol-3-phosphate dehydrogenase [Rhodospirillaceae bacterium]|nr:glycerol-3-phosphate dehydrogenase [Rhodospirillaceae bacterium]